MAVIVVEADDGRAAWLVHALSGLADRAIRTTSPDEAMAAFAAEGQEVVAAVVGPGLSDQDALDLAGRLQQAAPEVSVVLVRRRENGEQLRAEIREGDNEVIHTEKE